MVLRVRQGTNKYWLRSCYNVFYTNELSMSSEIQASCKSMWYFFIQSKAYIFHHSIVALFTQGIQRINNYANVFRFVDTWLYYEVGRWTIIYIFGGQYKHVRLVLLSHPNISFPTSHSQYHISGYLFSDTGNHF